MIVRCRHNRIVRLTNVNQIATSTGQRTQQLDLCNLHAVCSALVGHCREDQRVGRVDRIICEENLLELETVTKCRNVPRGNLGKRRPAVIGSRQDKACRITLRSIIGRCQTQTGHHSTTGRNGQTGIQLVEVQILRLVIVIDRKPCVLTTRMVVRCRHNRIFRLTNVNQIAITSDTTDTDGGCQVRDPRTTKG